MEGVFEEEEASKKNRHSKDEDVGTYIVNTIPPLNINLPNRGSAPDHNVNSPSFLRIFAKQSMLCL